MGKRTVKLEKDVAKICMQKVFTKRDLIQILDACKQEGNLAPLEAACFISSKPLTKAELKRGWKALGISFEVVDT